MNDRHHGPPPAASIPASVIGDTSRTSKYLKIVVIFLLPIFSAICIVIHVHSSAAVLQHTAANGFTPMPESPNDENTLYWIHQPGHLLHIVGLARMGVGVDIAVMVFTLFLALVAWMLRETVMPYPIAVLTVILNILCTGAFFAKPGYSTDLLVDARKGEIVSLDTSVKICDVRDIHIVMRHTVRGIPTYWPTAQLKSGKTWTLTVLNRPEAATQVTQAVLGTVRAVPCG